MHLNFLYFLSLTKHLNIQKTVLINNTFFFSHSYLPDKTNKVSSQPNEKERRNKYPSKSKTPYYRDELREKERLKRLYGQNNNTKNTFNDYKTQHYKHTKRNDTKMKRTCIANKINCKCTHATHCKSLNATTRPQIVYLPVPLFMQNPFMRFINVPMSMHHTITPVHWQQMQQSVSYTKIMLMPVPGPIAHANPFAFGNQYCRFN